MAWTTPRTWVAGEVVTDTIMNAHVRDNLAFLKAFTTNAQTSTAYTFAFVDAHNIVELANAGAITATVPPNSSVAFAVGDVITIIQTGAGQVTIAAGAGVTINANPGLKLAGQWATASLLKRATDTWLLIGNISS
jgi:hypothetical protein